ncbi:MAG: hypothetical protein ACD_46C00194G0004 [uncultured bacterium]|nr:MAG: hypothetical protein ACD_46C00194G0004 [uncultured bacterium]
MISTKVKNTTLIHGPVGQLEIAVEAADEPSGVWGIICHPHSLYGGTMNNKVVTTLAKTFQGLGATTVRFNFRGVGKSDGHFANGNGELDDLLAVIDWVHRENSKQEIWLAGFSFGAYIAAKAATMVPVKKLVTVAPAVQHFPMQYLPPILCQWVLVQGDQDDVVPPEAVYAWAESRIPPPKIIRFPEAGHFFHGQLAELRLRIEEALR